MNTHSYVRETLQRVDFSGQNLAIADFRGADIGQVHFDGADLTGANFTGAEISGASFIGAKLENAIFDRAVILNCNFDKSVCNGANFGASLSGTTMDEAELRAARFDYARIRLGSFVGAIAPHSSWTLSQLTSSSLEGVDLEGATLGMSSLMNCIMKRANLRRSQGHKTRFISCDLAAADLRGALFEEAVLSLMDKDLAGTILGEDTFLGAKSYKGEPVSPAIFKHSISPRLKLKSA